MATKYCRSIGGNWTTNATWSTTSSAGTANTTAPTAGDDVIIDAGSATGAPLVINAASVCRSINCTGFINTITHNNFTLSIGDGTAGTGNIALKFVSGMTYTLNSVTASAIAFVSTSTTVQTIDFGSKTVANVSFTGVGSKYALTSNSTMGATATLTLSNGTLQTDGTSDNSNLTHSWGLYVSTSGATRTLTLGNSIINITGTGTAWNASNGANATRNIGTSSITFSGASVTLDNGSTASPKAFYNVTFTGSGAHIYTAVDDTGSFRNLTVTGASGTGNSFRLLAGFTITNILALNGNSALNRLIFGGNSATVARTITNTGATMSWSNVDLNDLTLTTAYDASAITGFSGDRLGNTNITLTPAQDQYWFQGTGSWSDATKWFTATNGGGSAGRVPLPQDTARFDGNSIISNGRNITMDYPTVGTVNLANLGGFTTTLTKTIAVSVYGSLYLSPNISTLATSGNITFVGRGSAQLSSAGRSWFANGDGTFGVSMPGGTLTLLDTLNINSGAGGNRVFSVNNGTFDAVTFGVTFDSFTSTGSGTREIKMGTSSWNARRTSGTVWNVVSSLTITPGTSQLQISDTSASSKTFIGGGLTYNDLRITGGGSGAIIIQGSNTFNRIFNTTGSKTITMTAGTTTTLTGGTNAFFRGTSGNVITLQSSSAGNAWNVVKTSDYIASDYLSLKDSSASGGATFYAGANSTNVSGNSGWIFTMATFAEPTSITLVTILSETDVYLKYQETLSLTIVAVTTLTDKQYYLDLLNLVIVSTISISDKQTYLEALNIIILSSLTETDKQTYVEALSLLISCNITLTDFQTYAENLSVVINGIVTEQDSQSYIDNLNLLIQSQISIVDTKLYIENLNLTINSTITASDIYNAIENLNILLTSEISVTDRQAYVQSLNLLLTAVLEINEVYDFILTDFKPISLRRKSPIKLKLQRNRLTKVNASVQEPIKISLRRKNW